MLNKTVRLSDFTVKVSDRSILFIVETKGSKINFDENGKLHFFAQKAFLDELQPNISDHLLSAIAQIVEMCDVLSDRFGEIFSKEQSLVANLNESGELVVEFASIKPISEDEMSAILWVFVP